jgi:hypothetical protein
MKLEKDTFRIDLRSATICMELDCNTIFDAGMYRLCPTCGSAESYPLETWLNRERMRKPARSAFGADTSLMTAPRTRSMDRFGRHSSRLRSQTVPVALPLRAQRRAV